jgi:hypothetical protein
MNDEQKTDPDKFTFDQLRTGFRVEVGSAFDQIAKEMADRGFESNRVERALLGALIADAFDTMIAGGATLEETADFFSAAVNERIMSHQ